MPQRGTIYDSKIKCKPLVHVQIKCLRLVSTVKSEDFCYQFQSNNTFPFQNFCEHLWLTQWSAPSVDLQEQIFSIYQPHPVER